MLIGRVVGTVVSTQKHRKFESAKLLLVQPLNADDTARGAAILAVDGVGAGVHEKVLVVIEGRAAGDALRRRAAPVDAAIIGIVDRVTIDEDRAAAAEPSPGPPANARRAKGSSPRRT